MIDKNSTFYIKARKLLDEHFANGYTVEDLDNNSEAYRYIKNAKVKDETGAYIDLETKFELLGCPRSARYKDNKQELIREIEEYKQSGKSFHITRKSLPFYPRLCAYAKYLHRQGVDLTYEQIMKGLGYKDYSDTYFRCQGIFELKKYKDKEGFIDDYRKNEKLKAYIVSLGKTLDLPYYLVVTLLADEELNKCYIDTEYIEQVKTQLQQYVKDNGTLKGIKSKDKKLYSKFNTLRRYYGDGSEIDLTAEDWLDIFGLHDVENSFSKKIDEETNIKPIMDKFKAKFDGKTIRHKDLDVKDYRIILKKAIKLNISVKELFRNYGLNYEGNTVNRLSTMQVTEIPYLNEMREFRDDLLKAQGITAENGYCEEEIFEAKVEACKQAYDKFKDKMFNFTIDEVTNLEDVTNF